MDAGKRTIDEICNGSRVLEIPFYQRAYVWGEEQWERLLDDVKTVCTTKKPYFMGSIILKQQQTNSSGTVGDVRTVIDGQQRLTTLSILLKVLCLKKNEPHKFARRFYLDDDTIAIKHNFNNTDAFNSVMYLKEVSDLEGSDGITNAYRYFKDNVNPDELDFNTITSTILFVGIDLNPDEDEQQIFDTINSLGIRLTTAELLKNYFFGRDDINLYKTYWRDIFEKDDETKEYWDREITTGRIKRTFIDLFFYSYLQIRIQDANIKVTNDDKLVFSKVEHLFDSYKRFIKDYCDGDKRAMVEEIRDYAIVFKRAIDTTVVDAELPSESGITRVNAIVFALETTTLIPYILYIEKNIGQQSEKDAIYAFIEMFLLRRFIARETTKNYNNLFGEQLILNGVLSVRGFWDYLENKDNKVNRIPSDAEVADGFKSSVLTNKQAAGILYLLESKIRDKQRQSTQLLGISKYSLEHMMPKKWRNNWSSPGDEQAESARDRKLLTLGNLTIITQSLNTSIRDADWVTKKTGRGEKGGLDTYAKGIETLSQFLNLDVWDEAAIDSRAEYLAKKAVEEWAVAHSDAHDQEEV